MTSLFSALEACETYRSCFLKRHCKYEAFGRASDLGGAGFTGFESLIRRLRLDEELSAHYGCINTLRWNSSGTLLVSGSDDTNLGIWRIAPRSHVCDADCGAHTHSSSPLLASSVPLGGRLSDDDNWTMSAFYRSHSGGSSSGHRRRRSFERRSKRVCGGSRLLNLFTTGHSANIFHALFVPNTGDEQIVSCALDHHIYYNNLHKDLSTRIGTNEASCHKLDVVDQFTFLSCSEDGTVRLIDLRDKSTVNTSVNPRRVKNALLRTAKLSFKMPEMVYPSSDCVSTATASTTASATSRLSPAGYISVRPPKVGSRVVACYCMELNPLNSNVLAVGCRDEWVRLFDRRKLSLTRDGKTETPYCVLTQHCIQHKKRPETRRSVLRDADEGVTGLRWSRDGRQLVCTFSQRSIALFDLYAPKQCSSFPLSVCQSLMRAAGTLRGEDGGGNEEEEEDEEEKDAGVEEGVDSGDVAEGARVHEHSRLLQDFIRAAESDSDSDSDKDSSSDSDEEEEDDDESEEDGDGQHSVSALMEAETLQITTAFGRGIRSSSEDVDMVSLTEGGDGECERKSAASDVRSERPRHRKRRRRRGGGGRGGGRAEGSQLTAYLEAAALLCDDSESGNDAEDDDVDVDESGGRFGDGLSTASGRFGDGLSTASGGRFGDGLSTASGTTGVSRAATVGTEKDLALINAQTKAQIVMERARESREAAADAVSAGSSLRSDEEEMAVEEALRRAQPLLGIDEELVFEADEECFQQQSACSRRKRRRLTAEDAASDGLLDSGSIEGPLLDEGGSDGSKEQSADGSPAKKKRRRRLLQAAGGGEQMEEVKSEARTAEMRAALREPARAEMDAMDRVADFLHSAHFSDESATAEAETATDGTSVRLLEGMRTKLTRISRTVGSSLRASLRRSELSAICVGLEKRLFSGHRTVETVKGVSLLGAAGEYVASGSDCGHVFIWRKSDGQLVNILQGDSRICNVAECSPVNCTLATSGLDSSVKILRPNADCADDLRQMEDIVGDNSRRLQQPPPAIPAGLLFYLLRRGLIGVVNDDDDDEADAVRFVLRN